MFTNLLETVEMMELNPGITDTIRADYVGRRSRPQRKKAQGFQRFQVPASGGGVAIRLLYTAPFYTYRQSDGAWRAYKALYAVLAALILAVSVGTLLWQTAFPIRPPYLPASCSRWPRRSRAGFLCAISWPRRAG